MYFRASRQLDVFAWTVFYDDSLVLHCISLPRTIFASLARAHERVRVQNEKDFPQAKLDSEINARFVLNEHGDPHFLMHEFKLHMVIYNISGFEEKLKILLKNILILML